jgi:hypothetical protein
VGEIFDIAKGLTPDGSDAILVINANVNRVSDIWLEGEKSFMDGVDLAVFNCGVGA